MAVIDGNVAVSEMVGRRLQILTTMGVPLQLLRVDAVPFGLRALCACADMGLAFAMGTSMQVADSCVHVCFAALVTGGNSTR